MSVALVTGAAVNAVVHYMKSRGAGRTQPENFSAPKGATTRIVPAYATGKRIPITSAPPLDNARQVASAEEEWPRRNLHLQRGDRGWARTVRTLPTKYLRAVNADFHSRVDARKAEQKYQTRALEFETFDDADELYVDPRNPAQTLPAKLRKPRLVPFQGQRR